MALRGLRSGGTAHTEASVLQFITDLLKTSGVFDVLAGQFKVTAGSGLSVNVAAGRAYLLASGGNGYPTINESALTNQAINANASGNPRITSVVLYKDLGASPNADDTNTTHVSMVDGTPAASPSAPSPSAVQSAVGSGNPFIVLANVTVASGASSFVDGNIDRTVIPDVQFRSDIFNHDKWVTVNATGATTTLDLSLGKKFIINLQVATTTLAFVNVPLNQKSVLLRLAQDSTGSRLVTFWGGLSWPDGVTPPLTTTVNKADEFGFNFLTVTDDTHHTSEGFVVGQNI